MVAAAAMILAGVVHLAIFRQHWEHAPAHGLFFVVTGIAQVTWSVAYSRSRSPFLASAGFIISLTLVAFWTVTRFVRTPFGHGPEEVDLAGVVTAASETICLVALAASMTAATLARPRPQARRLILGLVVASLVFTGLTYSVAIAAEPLLPGLTSVEEVEHEETPEAEHDDHSSLPFFRTVESHSRS